MTAEIERLVADAQRDPALRNEVERCDGDLDAMLTLAASRGYAIERSELAAYVATRPRELGDGQLDRVAAGRGGPRDPAGDPHRPPPRWNLLP